MLYTNERTRRGDRHPRSIAIDRSIHLDAGAWTSNPIQSNPRNRMDSDRRHTATRGRTTAIAIDRSRSIVRTTVDDETIRAGRGRTDAWDIHSFIHLNV